MSRCKQLNDDSREVSELPDPPGAFDSVRHRGWPGESERGPKWRSGKPPISSRRTTVLCGDIGS
jgi:hypothetical protein